jgi:hypothetical protein
VVWHPGIALQNLSVDDDDVAARGNEQLDLSAGQDRLMKSFLSPERGAVHRVSKLATTQLEMQLGRSNRHQCPDGRDLLGLERSKVLPKWGLAILRSLLEIARYMLGSEAVDHPTERGRNITPYSRNLHDA